MVTSAGRVLFILAIALIIGFAIYGGLQYYAALYALPLSFWTSLVLAVAGGVYAGLGPSLDMLKKVYELRKLHFETQKLAEEAASRKRSGAVKLATLTEVSVFGTSVTEQAVIDRVALELKRSCLMNQITQDRVDVGNLAIAAKVIQEET